MQINYIPISEEALLCADLSINNDQLYVECCHVRDTQEGVLHSNVGGYQSPALFRETINQYPVLCELIDTMQEIIDGYTNQFTYKSPRKIQIGNFWLNFNDQHNTNEYHTHPHSVFSGAYYIKALPNSGTINFHRTSLIADTEWGHFFEGSSAADSLLNMYSYRVQPTPGKLVLFPSFYPHSVSPNNSGDMRLSLSFNSQINYL
jgi:uncharacterized protein (TIGR02466 family)